jgi:hypothetical protein
VFAARLEFLRQSLRAMQQVKLELQVACRAQPEYSEPLAVARQVIARQVIARQVIARIAAQRVMALEASAAQRVRLAKAA